MAFKTWEELENHFSKKENVIRWFGERGINLYPSRTKGCLHLSKFKWIDGMLFYVIKGYDNGCEDIGKTDPNKIEMCWTHREDGSSILIHECNGIYNGGIKDIPQIIEQIKEREMRDKEAKKQRELEMASKNLEDIKLFNIGDILVDGENTRRVDFFQIMNKKENEIDIQQLKSIYLGNSDIGMNYIMATRKNEFLENSKIKTLTLKDYLPPLLKTKTVFQYAGF